MDTDQWPEGIGVVKPMEAQGPMIDLRKPRPQKPQALNCPRCNSTHTKFCYYNNYSLTQPRYFCKSCRRYWTEGGSLRNVPVGGGSRKNKRSAPTKKLPDHHLAQPSFSQSAAYQNPKTIHEGQDLNLGYAPTSGSTYGNNISEFVEVPYNGNYKTYNHHPNTALSTSSHQNHVSAMELLKTGIVSNTIYSSGLGFQDFKQNINFSQHGFESGYGNLQGVQESTSARLFFPFEELKPVSTTTEFESNKGHGESNGYWNGGSW